MARINNTKMWYEAVNEINGCICPTCQTGKENLPLYPDDCPHASHLKITEPDINAQSENMKIKVNVTPKFECLFYKPLKEESNMAQQNANPTHDAVNHPSHYTTGGIECIDYIQEKLTPEEFRGYIKGNVIKHLTREQHKNGDEDIRKAQWYLNRLADTLTKKEETNNE